MINTKEKLEQGDDTARERGAALDLIIRGDLFAEVNLGKDKGDNSTNFRILSGSIQVTR